MIRAPSPHDFLLHLRGHCPSLARRLDGLKALERSGTQLTIRAPEGSWTLAELRAHTGALETEARRFFGPATTVAPEGTPADAEALPFLALSSKVWNHLAFWVQEGSDSLVLAVRKNRYLEQWLRRPGEIAAELSAAAEHPEMATLRLRAPEDLPAGESAATWVLPRILDDLCRLTRSTSSYAHLLLPFPGDAEADRLEGRLYGVKEWGTPTTPGPIFQKFTGRLHYVSPKAPPLGHRLALGLLRAQAKSKSP